MADKSETAELTRDQLLKRLDALQTGLRELPAGLTCPWPVARIFNELLKQSRREVPNDPILKGIRFFEEGSGEIELNSSNVLVGTVSLLAQQVTVALESESRRGGAVAGRSARAAGATKPATAAKSRARASG